MEKRIFLSPPCVGAEERAAVMRAFDSGYVAPCGPKVEAFERALAEASGRAHAVAVASGTAAIDLAMAEFGVDAQWTVIAPTLTFIATVGPAHHRGAKIVFVDSDATGNIDCVLLEEALQRVRRKRNPLSRTMVISVDLYGRCCDYRRLETLCEQYGAVLVCDAAEAVGARSDGRPAGSAGAAGVYSFNGNKIMTTSGGGAFLTDSADMAARARKRSQQSREDVAWYEHREVGYNYRMSNLLAAVGLAQLKKVPDFVARRAEIAAAYWTALAGRYTFLPFVAGANNWLTVAFAPSESARDAALARLAAANIEARPVWKPLHLQPVFAGTWHFGGGVAESLFRRGLCLPSGSGMSDADVARVVEALG